MWNDKEVHTMVFKCEPVPKGRPIFGKGFTYTPKKTRDAERDLRMLMRSQWRGRPIERPVRVDLIFSLTKPKSVKRLLPSVKPDIDNLIKLVTDCMNEIIIQDDNLIVEISARKEYGLPFIQLKVGEIYD